MIKSVPPTSPPDPDEGKTKGDNPDTAAFKKAREGSDSTDPNASKSKPLAQNKKNQTFQTTAKKTTSSSTAKGDNPTMNNSPKKVEGSEQGKSEKREQPSTQVPKKEEFESLKAAPKTPEETKADTSTKTPAKEGALPTTSTPDKTPVTKETKPSEKAIQKGDRPLMQEPPKKIKGGEADKSKAEKPPSSPKKEEFARLKTPQKTSKPETAAQKTPTAQAPAKPTTAATPKPTTPQAAPAKPGATTPKAPTAQEPAKPGAAPNPFLKSPAKEAAQAPDALEKPFELPETLKKAVLALKSQEKPGEKTAIIQSPEAEAKANKTEQVTQKDLVEVFKKARQNVPQARAVATEIREKYPEKAKELEKFIEKELHKLKPEPKKTQKAETKKGTSPFAELTTSSPKKAPETMQSPFTTLNLPQDIRAQAISITSPVANTLPTEMIPLFAHMVGTLIHMEKQGVSTTQIVLNNPEFSNSRFYGTKVTFDQYSTAPNTYNIRFTGSEEAVTLISKNVEGLYTAFNNADVGVKVNDIRAEHEPMEFKRKPSVGKDEDGGV